MIGRKLSNYEILERLGAGAMGEVYRARDSRLGREVALKVLPADFASDPERKDRFLREAHLTSLLVHPNIATLYAADEVDGILYFTMELVRGQTLQERIRAGGLPQEQVLDFGLQMAEGLAEAHRIGVIHRDLKPSNVMVDARGRVKILDFGLSRPSGDLDEFSPGLTTSGSVVGTPYYMSPEQMRGKKVDARSDLFSFGVTLYELATGLKPFAGETLGEVMESVFQKDPLPPDRSNPGIRPNLSSTIARLLEKSPERRFQSADELLTELRRCRDPAAPPAPPLPAAPPSQTTISPPPTVVLPAPSRRSPLLLGIGALLLAGGAALAFFLLRGGGTPPLPPNAKPLLAIVPFSVKGSDADAPKIARTLLYSLPQALASPAIEILSPTFLADFARRNGLATGPLDSETGLAAARQAGADWIVFGSLEEGTEGLALQCELVESRTGKSASEFLPRVAAAEVRAHVETLASKFRARLGIADAAPALATLSADPVALHEYAKGLDAMERLAAEEAEKAFDAALKADSDFALAHFHRARALGWMGSREEMSASQREFEAALRGSERLPEADREKAQLFLDEFWKPHPPDDRGRVARARALAAANPRDKVAFELWVEVAYHDKVEGSFREAIEACNALLALAPDYGPAHQHLLPAAAWAGETALAKRSAEFLAGQREKSPWAPQALLFLDRRDAAAPLAQVQGADARSRWHRWVAIHVALALDDYALAATFAKEGWGGNRKELIVEHAEALAGLGRFDEARALLAEPEAGDGIAAQMLRLDLGVEPRPADANRPWSSLFHAAYLARTGKPDDADAALRGLSDAARSIASVRRLARWVEGEIAWARDSRTEAVAFFNDAVPQPGASESFEVGQVSEFLAQRAARAFAESDAPGEAEKILRNLERERGRLLGPRVVSRVRGWYDDARGRAARGDKDARVPLERFLDRWSKPDAALPEIAEALALYERLAGSPWHGR